MSREGLVEGTIPGAQVSMSREGLVVGTILSVQASCLEKV